MKKLILIIFLFLLFPYGISSAATSSCLEKGYTLATVNGIFTDEKGARANKQALEILFNKTFNGEKLEVQYFHNPSHLGGLGDIAMSAYQKFFEKDTVKDYDLIEILKAASANIKTQKVLLIGYSQGNFYTNSFYDVVAGQKGGIPKESIGVYSVATPAGRVAGGGSWLTSTSDKVISGLVEKFPFRDVMKPNTNINLKLGDDLFGHSFTDVYLKYRGDKIVSDVKNSLDKLETGGAKSGSCMTPPKETLLHNLQGNILSLADPIAETATAATTATAKGIIKTTTAIAGIAGKVIGAVTGNSRSSSEIAMVEPPAPMPPVSKASIPPAPIPAPQPLPTPPQPAPVFASAAEMKKQMDKIQARIDELKEEEPSAEKSQPNVVVVAKKTEEPILSTAKPVSEISPSAKLVFSSSASVDKEIQVSLYASDLKPVPYDVKISIESGGVLSDIYDGDSWRSSNYYLSSAASGPSFSSKKFSLRIKKDRQAFRGSAEIIVRLRESGKGAGQTLFTGKIDIADPVQTSSPQPTPPPPAPSPVNPPPPPPPAPAPSAQPLVNLVFQNSTPVDQEINVSLSAYNLDYSIYDLKISIESGGVLSDIYDEIDWKSSNFYLISSIPGPSVSGRQFQLKIKESKQDFRGVAEIIVKLRKNGTSASATVYAGTINIANPISSSSSVPPPPPPTPSPTPPPPPPPSPEPGPDSNADHVVISQIQITGGAGATTNDFIEIHNPTDTEINLKGYRLVKRTAEGVSDSLIKSWTDDAFVPAHGYYLWANSGYTSILELPDSATSASIANDNGVAIRLGPNDTGEVIDSVAWGGAANAFIESAVFSTNPAENQTLIRKSVDNGYCVSASSDDAAGNGCDRDDNSNDFEISENPVPRHSNLEANRDLTDLTAVLAYSREDMEMHFELSDPDASYRIVDVSGNGTPVPTLETISTSPKIAIREVGRDYTFSILAFDENGDELAEIEKTVSVPSLATSLDFREDTNDDGKYLIDVVFASDPFIPDLYDQPDAWQGVVFYLNSEAVSEAGEFLSFNDSFTPANSDKALKISFDSCAYSPRTEYFMPYPIGPRECGPGGLPGLALKPANLENGGFSVEAEVPADSFQFSETDYITAAYYSFYTSIGGNQVFKLVALDKQKYFYR